MSAPSVSTRTIVRDTVMQMLESRKGQSILRVKAFAVSNRFLSEQETKQANTYCVIVTDEAIEGATQRARDSRLTLKLVLYAYDTKDPHGVLDAMIEDVHDLMQGLDDHADVTDLISSVRPESITADEATTAAGPWAQALCIWTLTHRRA